MTTSSPLNSGCELLNGAAYEATLFSTESPYQCVYPLMLPMDINGDTISYDLPRSAILAAATYRPPVVVEDPHL